MPKIAPCYGHAKLDQPVLDISGLWTSFGSAVVHQDLNLSVKCGEILSIVGGSGTGTGKTVLLRQMLGLERAQRGCVRVFGADISTSEVDHVQQLRNHSGMLFQQGTLYSVLTVFDNIAQPMHELKALPDDLVRDAVVLKMNMVGLGPEHANKMPSDLSGGIVKRVALEPRMLFLDEPTAGLDPDLSENFVALILSLHRKLSLTVVMVTHDLDMLFALSTRIAVLADKHVIAVGTTREVIDVEHPFIEHCFLGERGRRALAAQGEQQATVRTADQNQIGT
jgi:phospholipid/cholesterol/gamma-HCH transport system ATP-binding protein